MQSERPPRLRLFDILDCIRQIEQCAEGIDALADDPVRYRAIERWLEIISEASRHVGDALTARAPEIEWKQIADFGNVLRHGYQVVDPLIINNIVAHDLPLLKAAAARLYALVKTPADPWPDAGSK
jgi:uncharacterized protein with HEPN domain